MKSNEASLQKKLLPRHISFMAMGGVIGTGIFKGSSETISIAGPGVVLSYVLAGLLLLVVMGAIAEMALHGIPEQKYEGIHSRGFWRTALLYRGLAILLHVVDCLRNRSAGGRKLLAILVTGCSVMATESSKRGFNYWHQYDECKRLWRDGVLVSGNQNCNDYHLYYLGSCIIVWAIAYV